MRVAVMRACVFKRLFSDRRKCYGRRGRPESVQLVQEQKTVVPRHDGRGAVFREREPTEVRFGVQRR